jgi:hypothetical protein
VALHVSFTRDEGGVRDVGVCVSEPRGGCAEGDWQARVGVVWAGRWEESPGACQSGGMDTRDGGWVEKEARRRVESSSGEC